MKPLHRRMAACLCLVAVVAACVVAPDVQTRLSGSWQVVALGGTALPATSEVTLDFAAQAVSGMSGCNRYSGPYSGTGSNITFGPLALTRMACQPAKMDIELGFTRALGAATRYELADGMLRFYVADSLVMQAGPR